MSKLLVKAFWISSSLLITLYLGLAICLRLWQNRLIFFPSPIVYKTPKDIELNYEEVWLPVAGQKLNAWWIRSPYPNSATLLYFHGNASNLGDLVEVGRFFSQLGISVLLIDYRGYGNSSRSGPS
jgi:uncharacterized protein